MLRLALLMLTLLFAGCTDSSFVRMLCERQLGPASIKVETREDPVIYQNYRSRHELKRLLKVHGGEFEGDVTLGLATASYAYIADLTMVTLKGPGFACTVPRTELTLILKNPVVDVASELLPDSCRYKEILEHEEKHIAVYREHLRTTSRALEAEFRRRHPPGKLIILENVEKVSELHSRELNKWLTPTVSRYLQQAKELQKQIDTPEEYQRLTSVCPDEPLEHSALPEHPALPEHSEPVVP